MGKPDKFLCPEDTPAGPPPEAPDLDAEIAAALEAMPPAFCHAVYSNKPPHNFLWWDGWHIDPSWRTGVYELDSEKGEAMAVQALQHSRRDPSFVAFVLGAMFTSAAMGEVPLSAAHIEFGFLNRIGAAAALAARD